MQEDNAYRESLHVFELNSIARDFAEMQLTASVRWDGKSSTTREYGSASRHL